MRGILFDLDGTLYEDGVMLPGAADAVAALRSRGLDVGFVTNTTSRSRRLLSERLTGMGIEAPPSRIATALLAGARHLKERGFRRVRPLVPQLALEDLGDFEVVEDRPDVVLVGDLDDRWTFEILNTAFRQLMDGAELVALSADRYWMKADGLMLDCGPFLRALEYASGKTAAICGKPSAGFYRTGLSSLGSWAVQRPGDVLMVGDDIWGDIRGAQDAGLKACLVKTGKYREGALRSSGVHPDYLIEDVTELERVIGS